MDYNEKKKGSKNLNRRDKIFEECSRLHKEGSDKKY
jgi:hypothetical protein